MCGIVGVHLLDDALEPHLGELLSAMLLQMTDRGPDSSGVAVYGDVVGDDLRKYSCRPAQHTVDWSQIADEHGVVHVSHGDGHVLIGRPGLRDQLEAAGIRVVSTGRAVEVFKEVGLPRDVVERFEVAGRQGYQGVGHTRLATESAITTDGSHPFSTHDDLCVVHNGSFSNYFSVKRDLEAVGERFDTHNDTEVAARLLGYEMSHGRDLGDALKVLQKQLDGFYTLLCATQDQFAVVRDAVSCKPAVVAVHERYVAMASEYRALTELPDVDKATVFEPVPTEIYVWTRR
ncbi:MAG: glutamine amidotransferase [Ilumatobacteraceae bacterium]